MISFHEETANIGDEKSYFKGFRWAAISDFKRLGVAMGRYAWSPCRWQNGRRVGKNFIEAHLIGLDFDNGAMSLAQALNVFCDSAHIIGTTKSHQREKNGLVCDRFRVVLRLERPVVDVAVYGATVTHYIDKYDCDSACKDGARFFWPCKEIVSIEQEGYDQRIIEPKPKAPARNYSLYREARYVPRWVEQMLKFGVPPLTRNTSCLKLGIYLTKCGFSEAEIVGLIMGSPIPISPDVRPEVERAVANGARRGRAEIDNECQEETDASTNRGESMRAPQRQARP